MRRDESVLSCTVHTVVQFPYEYLLICSGVQTVWKYIASGAACSLFQSRVENLGFRLDLDYAYVCARGVCIIQGKQSVGILFQVCKIFLLCQRTCSLSQWANSSRSHCSPWAGLRCAQDWICEWNVSVILRLDNSLVRLPQTETWCFPAETFLGQRFFFFS